MFPPEQWEALGIYCVIAFQKVSLNQLPLPPPQMPQPSAPYYPGKSRFDSTLDAARYGKVEALGALVNKYIHTPNPAHVATMHPGAPCINPRLVIRSPNLASMFTQKQQEVGCDASFVDTVDTEHDYMDIANLCPSYSQDLWDDTHIDLSVQQQPMSP
uniref:Annexin A11 n=1 Tax=Lygus hesperus TaxID=30085 RepID=A0A0A9X7Y1_LYGHE